MPKQLSSAAPMHVLAAQVGEFLQQRQLQICTAESCTGGGLAASITDIAGSSAWFECGFITYSNAMKTKLLGVPPNVFTQFGAVSGECVALMAAGALDASGAHIAVAISGIAGPTGGTSEKPVGTVWIAWAYRADARLPAAQSGLRVQPFLFAGDRAAVRAQAVTAALSGVLTSAQAEGWSRAS
jgi:nicotinamide-nucleotide amidase